MKTLATIRQINNLGNVLQSEGQLTQARRVHKVVQQMLADDITEIEVSDSLAFDISQAETHSKDIKVKS